MATHSEVMQAMAVMDELKSVEGAARLVAEAEELNHQSRKLECA